MLMDVFVHTAPPEFMVHRTHFHDFMLNIHKMLRQFKGKDDQVKRVADHLIQVSGPFTGQERSNGRFWFKFISIVLDSSVLS